jgi:hypothetical protein
MKYFPAVLALSLMAACSNGDAPKPADVLVDLHPALKPAHKRDYVNFWGGQIGASWGLISLISRKRGARRSLLFHHFDESADVARCEYSPDEGPLWLS